MQFAESRVQRERHRVTDRESRRSFSLGLFALVWDRVRLGPGSWAHFAVAHMAQNQKMKSKRSAINVCGVGRAGRRHTPPPARTASASRATGRRAQRAHTAHKVISLDDNLEIKTLAGGPVCSACMCLRAL
jgi:hypothetical protein